MANTIRAAKNTFNNGLVMDLAPDTTPNEVLTSALNATLVTFNGNELLLQNDMGNGRVETARLPEGYIPVGTCEFGDIIYIVSYNPLTNRSQIGCFPSPERNISSEEIGSNGQTLSSSDFQEGSFDENEHFIPSGELKATSVKKIIYNNKMNPGDKYIIYDSNNQILNETHITDIGNTSHVYGAFPKLLRIHVVAIEDSGKINYLDSTIKWYNKKLNNEDVDYFMMVNKVESGSSTNAPDIDSYRDLLSSGYSVFQSKISGKLALLIELEKITGFSCTYNTYTSQKPVSISETGVIDSSELEDKPEITIDNIMNKKCRIYWNINWENDDNNINPKYIVLTKSEWGSKKPSENTERETKAGHYYLWRKDNLNVINDVKVDISSNIPKAYPYKNNEDVYWYAEISRLYNPLEDINYLTFINVRSYDKLLETALIPIKLDYNNQELYKLNLSRKDIKIGDYDYIGLPREDGNKSYYFINLISIERLESPQDPNAPTLYTGYISDFTNSEGKTAVNDYLLSDDIVNNYFHTSVSKFFYTFDIPVELNIDGNIYTPDTSNLIYHYEITPAMDYGLLREYSVEGYIDFSKIGTGLIDLTHWKYFNAENISTLTLGLDAYVEENKGIAEIALEFYDNQGYAATYHIRDKESYSGVFTEVIPLNGVIQNANLDDIDAYGEKHTHLGPEAADFAENVGYVTRVNDQPKYNPLYYKQEDGKVKAYKDNAYNQEYDSSNDGDLVLNDAGVIYGNVIYLVKIVVKYCQKDVLGNLDPSLDSEFKTFYRWYWTNTAFNSSYTNTNDFNILQPSLVVDADVRYEMDNSQYSLEQYSPLGQETDDRDLAKSAGVILQKMLNQQIKVYASPYLYNNYNTFKLLGNKNATNNVDKGVYYGLNLKICSGKRYIEQYLLNGSKEPPIQIHTGEYSTSSYAEWGGMEFVPGDSTSTSNMQTYYPNWRNTPDGYKHLTDDFRISFIGGLDVNHPEGYYINKNSEYISKSGYTEKYFSANNIDDGINVFTLNLQHYSKYYVISRYINKSATALVPIIQTVDDMDKYNIGVNKYRNPYIKTHLTILVTGQGHDTDDVKFWNHGGEGEEWSFWVDSDVDYLVTIDVWRVDEASHKSFKGTYLDCWNNINTVLLSLFDYETNKPMYHRQNGGSYGEGDLTGYSCNGKVSNLTDGDGRLLSPGFFTYEFYLSKPTSGDNKAGVSIGNQKNNTEGQNDFNANINIYGIGFVDLDHNLHLFNTKGYLSLVKDVFSELTQLYILNGADTLNVLSDIDIVYLLDNYTLYTLDVIYEYYSNGELKDNQLITIYDFNYIKYIEAILKKVGVTNNVTNCKFTDTKEISMNNVNITLKYSSRNVPLEFKMDYKKPNTYSSVETDDTKILLKMLGGSQKLASALDPINSTTLYQYVSTDNTVKEVDGSFKFNTTSIREITSGNIVPSFSSASYTASRFYLVFKYSGDYLDFVTKEYSAANDYWSYGHNYKGYVGTLCDLLIKDILIDGEQMIDP